MRVALVVPGFSRNEADWAIPVLQHLARQLGQKAELEIFSLRYPPSGNYRLGNVMHFATGGGTGFGLRSIAVIFRTIRAIWGRHRRDPFDVVHAFWADEAGLVAVCAARLVRRPSVVTFAGGELVYLPDLGYGTFGSAARRSLIRFVMRAATVLTVGSHNHHNLVLSRGARPGSVKLIPLGVDITLFKPMNTPEFSRPQIIQAASLVPVKNQRLLLRSFHEIRRTLPHAGLILAGNGPLQADLATYANNLGLSNHIDWLSAVPHTEMPGVYSQSHLYLQSSRYEAQGVAVLEALACGLPVIGTPVGLLPEVSEGRLGGDEGTLARSALELLTNQPAYEQARQRARRLAEANYSLVQNAESFLTLYRAVNRSKSPMKQGSPVEDNV